MAVDRQSSLLGSTEPRWRALEGATDLATGVEETGGQEIGHGQGQVESQVAAFALAPAWCSTRTKAPSGFPCLPSRGDAIPSPIVPRFHRSIIHGPPSSIFPTFLSSRPTAHRHPVWNLRVCESSDRKNRQERHAVRSNDVPWVGCPAWPRGSEKCT